MSYGRMCRAYLVDYLIGNYVVPRVNIFSVNDDFIVEVRSRGNACAAHECNFLVSFDPLPHANQNSRSVRVFRNDTKTMIDRDELAIARYPPSVDNGASGTGDDGRVHVRRYVNSLMSSSFTVNGVHAVPAEAAGKPTEG